MTVDTTPLHNWPSPGSITATATDLGNTSQVFSGTVEVADQVWQNLSSYYHTPTQEALYLSLAPARQCGEAVERAGAAAAALLMAFADHLGELEQYRGPLEHECAAHNALPVPTEPAALTAYQAEERRLTGEVTILAHQLREAAAECARAIRAIKTDGSLPDLGDKAYKYGKGPAMGLVSAIAKGRVMTTEIVRSKSYVKLFGTNVPIPFSKQILESNQYKHWESKLGYKGFGRPDDWTFRKTFAEKLSDRFLLEKAKPFKVVGEPVVATKSVLGLKFSKETTTLTQTSRTLGTRVFTRSMGAAGTALTVYGEYGKRMDKLNETNPTMSDGEKNAQALKAGVVRGGGQVVATAATTAAICSVVPGIGTVGGFVVGAAVGGAMQIPTGGGKTVGDRVGDASEAVVDGTVDAVKTVGHGIAEGARATEDALQEGKKAVGDGAKKAGEFIGGLFR